MFVWILLTISALAWRIQQIVQELRQIKLPKDDSETNDEVENV